MKDLFLHITFPLSSPKETATMSHFIQKGESHDNGIIMTSIFESILHAQNDIGKIRHFKSQ